MSSALSATPAALAIEITPEAAFSGRPPEPLGRDNAEMLAAPIADDLRRIIGEEIAEAGLILPAAIYDVPEILQPGLPMVEALLDIYRGSLRGGAFQPQLLSIGSSGGRFPASGIAPTRQPGSGPLLIIPMALVAPGSMLDPLTRQLESTLIEKGRASLATDRAVRQLFGLEPVHLSYVTFNDLAALMRVQMEHAQFAPLWQLIESALYRPDDIERVSLASGNQFIGMGGAVYTPWLTFDQWAAANNSHGDEAEHGYIEWMQRQRQYMTGLIRHGITLHITEPATGLTAADREVALSVAQAKALATDSLWYRETIQDQADARDVAVVTLTEQAHPQLGPIAYTVLVQAEDGRLLSLVHDYPTDPGGIPAIIAYWRERAEQSGAQCHIERPGRLLSHGKPAHLQPWLDYDGEA